MTFFPRLDVTIILFIKKNYVGIVDKEIVIRDFDK
jgi:hypothetical protein